MGVNQDRISWFHCLSTPPPLATAHCLRDSWNITVTSSVSDRQISGCQDWTTVNSWLAAELCGTGTADNLHNGGKGKNLNTKIYSNKFIYSEQLY